MATCSDWNNVPEDKSLPELRILMIGKTGQDKSTTGNSILDRYAFETSGTAASCTAINETKSVNRFGCHIRVTDTPGFFDTEMTTDFATHSKSNAKLRHLLLKSLLETIPGLDAILFVVRKGEKFTPEMKEVQSLFFEWFGPGVEKYAHLVLTHCNNDTEAQNYFGDGTDRSLLQLAQRCGNRIIAIENKGETTENQVQDLVNRIRAVKEENGGHSYIDKKYEIVNYIAGTVHPSRISPESLSVMENSDPTIKSLLKSMNLLWNIPIVDDSEGKVGLLFPKESKENRSNNDGGTTSDDKSDSGNEVNHRHDQNATITSFDTTETDQEEENSRDHDAGNTSSDTIETDMEDENRRHLNAIITSSDTIETDQEEVHRRNHKARITSFDTTETDQEVVHRRHHNARITSFDTTETDQEVVHRRHHNARITSFDTTETNAEEENGNFIDRMIRFFRKSICTIFETLQGFFNMIFFNVIQ